MQSGEQLGSEAGDQWHKGGLEVSSEQCTPAVNTGSSPV